MKLLNIILSERLKVKTIDIAYTTYGDLYGIYVNGKKIDRDEGVGMIQKITKLELPYSYEVISVDHIIKKLSDAGIEADDYEMDID
jgi:hypothetical protein|tara:strand:+ start:2371 stop:2628 length:258 start_codon:yes stop_codon:yes gene_type:complete